MWQLPNIAANGMGLAVNQCVAPAALVVSKHVLAAEATDASRV